MVVVPTFHECHLQRIPFGKSTREYLLQRSSSILEELLGLTDRRLQQ